MSDLTHLDEHGAARMVDVGGKADTARRATAGAEIRMSAETLAKIMDGGIAKGDVIATARIAGIMAAKRTHELIPLCHPLALTHVALHLAPLPDAPGLAITAEAATTGKTGVEMEALTAASVAALTVYDMIKAVEPGAVIGAVRLTSKTGGKSDVSAPVPAAPTPPPAPPLVSRGFRNAPARGKPVDMIRPAAAAAQGSRADHFRRYLAQSGAQVTQWARQAGLPAALVYSFLHGRVGRLPRDAEEKLAAAAGVSVAALFGEG